MAAEQQPLCSSRAALLQPAPSPYAQSHWTSSWLKFGGSLDICCVGLFCPCILYAHNVAQMHDEPRFSMATCLTYLCIPLAADLLAAAAAWALAPVAAAPAAAAVVLRMAGALAARAALAAYASPARRELRRQEGIPGSAAADCALWCLLPSCMLCQEAAQLAARQQLRKATAAGGAGGSAARLAAAVEPPQQQFIMQSAQLALQAPCQQSRRGAAQVEQAQRAQQPVSVVGGRSSGYAALPAVEPPPLPAVPPAQHLICVRA